MYLKTFIKHPPVEGFKVFCLVCEGYLCHPQKSSWLTLAGFEAIGQLWISNHPLKVQAAGLLTFPVRKLQEIEVCSFKKV